jgi:hypothetical protein
MEFTIDQLFFIIGILIGVFFTLIGIEFTEYLRNKREKKRLITALYNEVKANIKMAGINKIFSNGEEAVFFPFYTIAYDQYKLGIMIDEKYLSFDLIVDAYAYAEFFNNEIKSSDYFNNRKADKETKLITEIEKKMLEISSRLSNKIKVEKL